MSQSAEKSLSDLLGLTRSMVTSLANLVARVQGIEGDQMIFEYFKEPGDSIEMAVDGDPVPVVFSYTAPARVLIERINFHAIDGSFEDPVGFFSLGALSNGLTIQLIRDAAVIQHFGTDVAPITLHNQFANLAGTDADASTSAANTSRFSIRWTISRAGNPLLMLAGDILSIAVADDLTALSEFRAMIQGTPA